MTIHPTGLAAQEPPHDEEAEASVLGAIMLADRWFDPIAGVIGLRPDDFYRPRNRVIFKAMMGLSEIGEPIDTLTVSAALDQYGLLDEAGGKDYIETLVTRIPAIGNTKQYGQIVKENSDLRRLIRAAQMIQESVAAREGDPQDLIERAQNMISEVAGGAIVGGGLKLISTYLLDQIAAIETAAKRETVLTGVTTGLHKLDELTHGLQPGNLIIIAGRPSQGKSALAATTIPLAALAAGVPTAVFSLEMSEAEVTQRMLAADSRLELSKIQSGDLPETGWVKLMESGNRLDKMPFHLDADPDQTVMGIRSKVRQTSARLIAQDKPPIGLVVIDYLQLLRSEDTRQRRDQAIGQMTRSLKLMARELGIPVVVLSQLSREVERRQPPKPILSDLRDSGEIEQDADVVIFVYREEWYDKDSDRKDEADLIIAKHRNGARGEVPVVFIGHRSWFCDLQPQTEKPNVQTEDAAEKPFVVGRDDPGDSKEQEEIVF